MEFQLEQTNPVPGHKVTPSMATPIKSSGISLEATTPTKVRLLYCFATFVITPWVKAKLNQYITFLQQTIKATGPFLAVRV